MKIKILLPIIFFIAIVSCKKKETTTPAPAVVSSSTIEFYGLVNTSFVAVTDTVKIYVSSSAFGGVIPSSSPGYNFKIGFANTGSPAPDFCNMGSVMPESLSVPIGGGKYLLAVRNGIVWGEVKVNCSAANSFYLDLISAPPDRFTIGCGSGTNRLFVFMYY